MKRKGCHIAEDAIEMKEESPLGKVNDAEVSCMEPCSICLAKQDKALCVPLKFQNFMFIEGFNDKRDMTYQDKFL